MAFDEQQKLQPDPTLTPQFSEDDIRGRPFGKSYPQELQDGLSIIKHPDNSVYAIRFRFDPLKVNQDKALTATNRLRPKTVLPSLLTFNIEKADYNTSPPEGFDVVTLRFDAELNAKKWGEKQRIAFAKRVRTAWQFAGKAT